MRPFSFLASFFVILTFSIFLGITLFLSIYFYRFLPFQPFRDILTLLFALTILFLLTILLDKIITHIFPLSSGVVPPNSPTEIALQTITAVGLFTVFPLARPCFIPPPLSRGFYRLLGVTIGENSYPGTGFIGHPFSLVTIGKNVIFGGNHLVTSHVFETGKLVIGPIRIGDNVTLGVNSVIMPNTTIEDNAIVAAGAIVTKGTYIGQNEIWGGIPAKKIGVRSPEENLSI